MNFNQNAKNTKKSDCNCVDNDTIASYGKQILFYMPTSVNKPIWSDLVFVFVIIVIAVVTSAGAGASADAVAVDVGVVVRGVL